MTIADQVRARFPEIRRLAWRGAIVGAIVGALTVASARVDSSNVDLLGQSATRWCVFFVFCGFSAGAIAGSLRPLADSRIGAAVVGIMAAIPGSVAADVFIYPGSPADPVNVISSAIVGVVIGAMLGLMLRRASVRRSVRGPSDK